MSGADILRPLAPVLTAGDDTFTIRADGETRDAAGNATARAWCEATVRRTREFVDPRSRMVAFNDQGRRTPRVLAFSDFRPAPDKDGP